MQLTAFSVDYGALADAARAAGHHVSLEAVAAHAGWQADVLAAGPEGHVTAWRPRPLGTTAFN
ncbi:hypothetical protein ABZ924_27965 [Streptomyces sp. NPDC046876]|uniref:hypothetical protein n=1 Tax=Streptomyces sp. NPDC046876 TaxID=3155616 RepID=UPI0033F83101